MVAEVVIMEEKSFKDLRGMFYKYAELLQWEKWYGFIHLFCTYARI